MRARLGLVLFAVAMVAPTPPRVAIVRAPAVTWEDEPITVQVQVAVHADNRWLVVAAVDDGLVVRQSVEQLDGIKAPRTRWIRWRLGAGELQIVAMLYEASEHAVARDTASIVVLSRR